jgi:hypothetical protein
VGADRRGPLVAFIVIAVIAAILLVTSVRSRAAPRWVDRDEAPATVIRGPGADDAGSDRLSPLEWRPR